MFKFLMREYYLNNRMWVSAVDGKKVNNEESGFQATNLKNLNIEFKEPVVELLCVVLSKLLFIRIFFCLFPIRIIIFIAE
jgi:hypothetical protein